MDKRYDFPCVVAVKIAVVKDDKIFLIRELETNAWMPGRLGLPGGKIFLNESIDETLQRKIETEIGFKVKIKGLIKVINMPLKDRNVYQFVFMAEYLVGKPNLDLIEAKEARWFSKEELARLSKDDFTEFYNDQLLIDILNNKVQTVSMDIIITQSSKDNNFISWIDGGSK